MSRLPLIVIMLGLIAALPAANVYGANTQGLQWGLKGGDRLYYDVLYYSIQSPQPSEIPPGVTVHEKLYVEIYPLSPLPATVTQLQQITLTYSYYYGSNYSLCYQNGSMVGFLMSIIFIPPIIAFPVGDWPLVASFVYPASSPGFEVIDNQSMWGLVWDSTATYGGKTANIYSKSDGALYQYTYELHNITTDEQLIKIVTNRVSNNTDASTLTDGYLAGIAVSIAVVSMPVVIIIAVLLIRKHPQ